MSASDLYGACVALLADAVAALATTDAGAPAYAVVSPGSPVYDCCPMVSVHWTPIGRNAGPALASGPLHQARAWLNSVQFTVTALRCSPKLQEATGTPLAIDVNTAAKSVADDAWALNSYISARIADGTLFGPYPCNEIVVSPITQLQDSGGAIGCQYQIQATIQGYAS